MPALIHGALIDASYDSRRTLKSLTPLIPPMVIYQGRSLINFSSNDYLNLSRHPLVQEKSIEFIRRYGAGSPSSRLVSGNIDCYEKLERKLAQLTGFEAALIFPSGFQLNSTVLPTFLNASSRVLADSAIHRSIIEGLRLSKCRLTRFAHLDEVDLKRRLADPINKSDSNWVIVESVYSVDGSLQDLNSLTAIALAQGSKIYLDEAHAIGLFGTQGMGFAAGRKDIDIVMGCFSKAIGSMGGYVLCSNLDKQYLVNYCPGLIYSTALPPAVLGAIDAALSLIPLLDDERNYLQNQSKLFREKLTNMGFDIGASMSNIVSIFLKSEREALTLSAFLAQSGFLAVALRPPTTGKDTSAVRFSITSAHKQEDLEKLLAALLKYKRVSHVY